MIYVAQPTTIPIPNIFDFKSEFDKKMSVLGTFSWRPCRAVQAMNDYAIIFLKNTKQRPLRNWRYKDSTQSVVSPPNRSLVRNWLSRFW